MVLRVHGVLQLIWMTSGNPQLMANQAPIYRGRITFTVMTLVILLSGCSQQRRGDHQPAPHASPTAHWDYGNTNGPVHWGELNPDFSLCSKGLEQSPVNLSGAPAAEHPEFSIDYLPATLKIIRHEHVVDIIDNGHTIQVNYDEGSTITAGDTVYDLMQYHFHAPSEHTIDSRHSPMEMHLVHQSPSGQLVVVGVLIEEGEHNPAFEPVWRNLPHEAGEARHLEHVTVNVDDLLPRERSAYSYRGSLTTPPCSEGVRWFVAVDPIQLSASQIRAFTAIFQGNNRPVQPLNERIVTIEAED